MNSKYAVFALAFLLTFSAIPLTHAATLGTMLPPINVDTHGPRVSTVTFEIISDDTALSLSLGSGAAQVAEWSFLLASYLNLAANNTNVATGETLGYTFDGIAFNFLHPTTSNVHFRRAISYMTDYANLQSILQDQIQATPYPMPDSVFPFMTGNEPTAYGYDLTDAATELVAAGFYPDVANLANANSTTIWCKVDGGGGRNYACPGNQNAKQTVKFQWRTDDPLRTEAATEIVAAAKSIGWLFNEYPRVGGGGSQVYTPSASSVISDGVYNPSTGYNSPAVFNMTYANSPSNTWDLYTFGWIASANFLSMGQFWNSQMCSATTDFVNIDNDTVNYYSNAIMYAKTNTAAEAAAINLALPLMQQLPYEISFYQNTLWAEYINGWTHFANIPATGPGTVGGLYYTLLNAHAAGSPTGGDLTMALHMAADAGGMNPTYGTNWVWQADLWSEFYDTPLATAPTLFRNVNGYIDYMTTSHLAAALPLNFKTPAGATIFQSISQKRITIAAGQVITYNFAKNLTWSDGVPFTAKDYLKSLLVWNEAINPKYPDLQTPLTGAMAGASGLLAAKVTGTYQIKIYVGSENIWNLANTVIPVFPEHILRYFNLDQFSTPLSSADLTLPYLQLPNSFVSGGGAKIAPTWMKYEPNMEIGTGPFTLTAFDHTTGNGMMTANPTYFRTAFWENQPTVTTGSSYTHNYNITLSVFNPSVSTNICAVGAMYIPPGGTGLCKVAGPVGLGGVPGMSAVKLGKVVQLYHCLATDANTGAEYRCQIMKGYKYSIVKGAESIYSVSIPTTGLKPLSPGNYEAVLTTHYNYLGLTRTYYEAQGFTVS